MTRKTTRKAQQVTQSYKLYALLLSKKQRTREQIAKALDVNAVSVGGYLHDLKRLYGVKIEYNGDKQTYVLRNRAKVPPTGVRALTD